MKHMCAFKKVSNHPPLMYIYNNIHFPKSRLSGYTGDPACQSQGELCLRDSTGTEKGADQIRQTLNIVSETQLAPKRSKSDPVIFKLCLGNSIGAKKGTNQIR